MTTFDWDEVKRLAADFQRAQLSSTIQRLSERNCVEIVQSLIEEKLLDVIFTTDGKEYVTPNHLIQEIKDELYVSGGRINLVELAKILNVDLSHVTARAQDIIRTDKSCKLVLGQLIDKRYLNRICEEVNDKLRLQGQITFGEITRQYDLPGDFLQGVIENELGRLISGQQDKTDPRLIFTEAFVGQTKACIRGALSATTRPITVASILSHTGLQEKLFFSVAESLIQSKQVAGNLSGKQGGSAQYIPTIYSKTQHDWVVSFYKQNGYLEYPALIRLGILEPKQYVRTRLPSSDQLKFLNGFCVGSLVMDQLEAAIEEAKATSSWLDILGHLPSVFGPDEAGQLLSAFLETNNGNGLRVFCKTIIVTDPWMERLADPLIKIANEKAKQSVACGAFQQHQVETRLQEMRGRRDDVDEDFVNVKESRRDERRRKAGGGKQGGGVQGRETKTKSSKSKKGNARRAGGHISSDEETENNSGSSSRPQNIEFVSLSEIEKYLFSNQEVRDVGVDEFITELALHFLPEMNKIATIAAKAAIEAALAASAQNRRHIYGEIQDKINTLASEIRIFDKAIKLFVESYQTQLGKYLLRSHGILAANEVLSYAAQEFCGRELSPSDHLAENRTKIILEMPPKVRDALQNLFKNANMDPPNAEEFLSSLEIAIGNGICDMILRKPDKKKERAWMQSHRQNLIQELTSCDNPTKALILSLSIIFQSIHNVPVHAGLPRFLSWLIHHLKPLIPVETSTIICEFHDGVQKLLTTNSEQDEYNIILEDLQSKMPTLKDATITFKKGGEKNSL